MLHRYAIFSAVYLPHTGGVETYTHYLTDELVRQGSAVEIVTVADAAEYSCEQERANVCVHRLPGKLLLAGRLPVVRKNQAWRSALDTLAEFGIDRVLVNTRFYGLSLDGLAFAKRIDAPALVLDHGSAHLSLGNVLVDKVIERYEHAMTNKVKAFRPLFAGVSHKSVGWLKHFGIHTDTMLPNAIDAQDFRGCASERDFRVEFGISGQQGLVAYAGRIAPEKGVVQIVEAAKLLVESGFEFVLAGDGPLRSSLQQNSPANVHFLGSLSRADVSALFQASDVFCLPSRSEGFCTALLEAAACGLPLVTTDVGGAQELVPDSSYGCIVHDAEPATLADSLRHVADCLPATSERRAYISTRVEQTYRWEDTARLLDEAFSGFNRFVG